MADNTTEPLENEDDDDFKLLRAKAKKADALERENETLKRQMAFTQAGIPMDDPRIGYFVKGYEGELEPDAIRQAAVTAGFITVQQAPDPALDQAREGQERVLAATGGQPLMPQDNAVAQMDQAYAEGGLAGLSSVSRQFGISFEPEEI